MFAVAPLDGESYCTVLVLIYIASIEVLDHVVSSNIEMHRRFNNSLIIATVLLVFVSLDIDHCNALEDGT